MNPAIARRIETLGVFREVRGLEPGTVTIEVLSDLLCELGGAATMIADFSRCDAVTLSLITKLAAALRQTAYVTGVRAPAVGLPE